MENIIIQSFNSDFYLWKLETHVQTIPNQKLYSWSTIKNYLIKRFFDIPRGYTTILEEECKNCLGQLEKLFINLKLNHNTLISKFVSEFQMYHSELDTEKIKKLNDLIKKKIQTAYVLKPQIQRFIGEDLLLTTVHERFIAQILEFESLDQIKIFKEFVKAFKSFFVEYNPSVEKVIKASISEILSKYESIKEMLCLSVNERLTIYLSETIQSLTLQQSSIECIEIQESSSSITKSH